MLQAVAFAIDLADSIRDVEQVKKDHISICPKHQHTLV